PRSYVQATLFPDLVRCDLWSASVVYARPDLRFGGVWGACAPRQREVSRAAQSAHRPNSSIEWVTWLNPWAPAARCAHSSMPGSTTSTVYPQSRHTRRWWLESEHLRKISSPESVRSTSTAPASDMDCRVR